MVVNTLKLMLEKMWKQRHLSHATSEVLLLELLPAGKETNKECETSAGNGHGESDLQTLHIPIDDDRLLLGSKCVADFSGSGKHEGSLADLRSVLRNVFDHFVDEGGLTTGDDESTTKTLEDCELLVMDSGVEKMGVSLQSRIPVAEERSLGETVPWTAIMGIWKAVPQPKPATIW